MDDVNDLPDWHPDKPKRHNIDINKINARDHLTVWNESKWGKQLGMWVQPVEGRVTKILTFSMAQKFQKPKQKIRRFSQFD